MIAPLQQQQQLKPTAETPVPALRLGHVHLKVRDMARAVAFYTDVFGLRVTETVGNHYAFLSGSDVHHEIALQNVGPAAPPSPNGAIGLYHVAFEVSDRQAFAHIYRKLQAQGVEVQAVNHGISLAMYFADPDGNGLEIYVDTRHDPNGAATWQGLSRPLNLT